MAYRHRIGAVVNPYHMIRKCIGALLVCSLAGSPMSHAELTVIYDSGNTRPIAPFLEVFDVSDIPRPPVEPTTTPQLGAADPANLLPLRPTALSPGPVTTRSHDRPFSRPFFLIGSDSLSRQWLAQHAERLEEIGAVGMLVQAEAVGDLHAIARLAVGLPIQPGSADDIAEVLGIEHYPVLITSTGIEQ